MRRVVVTGLGIVSCIGNNKTEVLDSSRTENPVLNIAKNTLNLASEAMFMAQ